MTVKFKRILALTLVSAMCCLLLCSCGGISEDDAVGTWSGSYVYNGNTFSVKFNLSADGKYAKVTTKNGSLDSAEDGTWEIKSGDVVLHKNGSNAFTSTYEYESGALVNNGHKFTKS